MGRPREFEMDEVLEAAIWVFRANGFECASLTDLTRAMGLQKGSIYKAFHDKRTLFLKALERYLDQMFAETSRHLTAPGDPVEAIREWGLCLLKGCSVSRGARGCLAVNSMVELGPKDSEAAASLSHYWRRVEALLNDVLARGQARERVRGDLATADLARIFTHWAAGTAVFARGESCENRLRTFEALIMLVEARTVTKPG